MFFVESREELPVCPTCGGTMRYRDSRKRILRKEGGEVIWLMIRRFCCTDCHRHHTELPDCLTPFKHYSTEVISGVIDEIISPMDEDAEDYPCLQTMIRWLRWFRMNLANIEGYLRNAGCYLLELSEQLLYSKDSLLDAIRDKTDRWLEMILRIIYNSGGRLSVLS